MSYRDNVTALAKKFDISNDPGLREEDLRIAGLRFYDNGGEPIVIVASEKNRGARLFLQDEANGNFQIEIDDAFRTRAAKYFAELWEENPEPGKRSLIDAVRNSIRAEIVWKHV